MTSGLSFLLAARRCEIEALDQLAATSALVAAIARLVHALQRERGISNVLLASGGRRFAPQRLVQVGESLRLEHAVRAAFDALGAEPDGKGHANGARLFSCIASVLPGLDALPALRRRVAALELAPDDATAGFVRLIAGLLAVVFEAADGATDPDISRALAAMFNFMQAKEFAGQERACGAAAFATGRMTAARQQQWLQLIASQERCFAVFADFAGPMLRELWQRSEPVGELAELERLRRVGCVAGPDTVLDADLSTTWFDCCSLRIDAMQAVEEQLCADLRTLCLDKIAQTQAQAATEQALLDRWLAQPAQATASDAFFAPASATPPAPPTSSPYGHQFERSMLDLLREQSRRLQVVSDELQAVREALNERKLVERAKGLLMAHRKLNEAEAHKMLRLTAMNQNRRLVDVAESVLQMAEYLPETQAHGA